MQLILICRTTGNDVGAEVRGERLSIRKWSKLASAAIIAVSIAAMLPTSSLALRRPALVSPASSTSTQSLSTFAWRAVRGAAKYQFQLAADRRFGSIVFQGSFETYNTAATFNKELPDGKYYWRVRALSAKDRAGPWSRTRILVKAWTAIPALIGPNGTDVNWPSEPLVFSWSQVPHATQYLLTVATDSSLAHQVIGSSTNPLKTDGTVYTPSASLTPGTYFWAVTPLDADGHTGRRSVIGSFNYSWPSATTPGLTDLSPDPRVFGPLFTWDPVPGAARYEVEVNAAYNFPSGSKWCCSTTTLGTSMAPQRVLANNAYYWRVRAINAGGTAGIWNYYGGATHASFTKAFDSATPTVSNLAVTDLDGAGPLSGTTSPIVTWGPVPGASLYAVQLAPYSGGLCDWSQSNVVDAWHAQTASLAWTPLASGGKNIGPPNGVWPTPQETSGALVPGAYCFRVAARSDNDAQNGQVVSNWTQIGGESAPAFVYNGPPAPGPSGSLQTQPSEYLSPAAGVSTTRTPLFTWKPVANARAYYVVIARDAGFTDVADVGFTYIPAYAPRLRNGAPLADETTAYYWAVIPALNVDGTGVSYDDPGAGQNSPQTFDKSSIPPTLLSPSDGQNVSTQPHFTWSEGENAKNYTLQVAADPSFGSPIDDVTTDATAYTSNSTYPADQQVYWRVRANDWAGNGLNWSATQTFIKSLPVPAPSLTNTLGGETIPVLNWSPVQGAVGYQVHVDKIDGTTDDFTFAAPAFTPVKWYGVGVWRWRVRATFPTNGGAVTTGGYSTPEVYVRTLNAPTGARGARTRTRLVISWRPDPAAKQYQVDLSTSDGFAAIVSSDRTDNASWAPNIDLRQKATRGRLYWRVAAVDGDGNVGTYATGSVR
jgi:hypothetical protein